MSNASAQVRVDLTAIKDSVACFGSGRQAEYCAVLEVAGSQQSLAKVDEAKQEELLAGYAQFLNSLTFVFQLVVQVHPVDLAWYVARVEERARFLSPSLVAISRQLTDRCDAIGRQLSRAGLRTARLDDVGLAQLYHSSWAPEIARSQRLRRELTDYTALVVGATIRPSRSIRGEEIDGVASLE